jgi:GH18 family chitinase
MFIGLHMLLVNMLVKLSYDFKGVWGNFSSLHSWFYEVTMLESPNAIGEGKMQVYF